MDKRFLSFFVIFTIAMFAVKLGFNYYDTQKKEEWLKTHKPEIAKQDQQALSQPQKKQKMNEEQPLSTTALPHEKPAQKKAEKFFVLENPYQQLVFSNIGGSLVEVNLPFKTKENQNSVVLPIDFDREIIQQSPDNALFPLHPAVRSNGKEQASSIGGYYPLLRRDQILKAQPLSVITIPPRYTGLDVTSEFPEVAELSFDVKKFTENEIVFEAVQPHRRITKRYAFYPDVNDAPYCIQFDVKIDGDTRGLWLTSGVPEVEWISGSSGSTILYHVLRGNSSTVEKIDLPKDVFTLTSASPDWVCNSNGFFGFIVDPLKGSEAGFRAERVAGKIAPSRLSLIDSAYDRFPANDLPGFNLLLPLKSATEPLKFRIFAGPFDNTILKKVDSYFAQESGGRASDYVACQTFHGWFSFISEPFAKFLFFLMNFFYNCFGSWVLSIVLITVVLRILLYPLNSWSLRSMKRMQLIAPKMKALQEKYKKEPQKAQLEILNLYKEHGVNPFSGCLPLLIQMPFLIGMFDLLKSTFELRGASFIPGWINDLSAPDVLFSWDYPLPLIGNEFHLLPFILAGIMFIQQNMMSGLPKDPTLWTEQQRQQRAMGNVMTLVMTILFYQFPSGLNIYWISSMLLGILQQWWTNKNIENEQDKKSQKGKKVLA